MAGAHLLRQQGGQIRIVDCTDLTVGSVVPNPKGCSSIQSLRRFVGRSLSTELMRSRVTVACVANQNSLLHNAVPTLRSCGTGIDRMAIVETAAYGVALSDLDTHAGRRFGRVAKCLRLGCNERTCGLVPVVLWREVGSGGSN